MKKGLLAVLMVALVPIQTTVLEHVSIGGIRPDLCLIVVCLVGVMSGEVHGMFLGLALGFAQDIFSAGELWLNMVAKGMIGFLAGFVSRHLANATPGAMLTLILALSFLSGLVFLVVERAGTGLLDALLGVRLLVLPQAAFDAAVGTGVYWLVAGRTRRADVLSGRRISLR